MKEAPLIEIKGLNVGYEDRIVLHHIDLNVYERDFLGIIGPNGGGKTTLMRCILGLLKPRSGQIIFHPRRPRTMGQGLSIGYLPQYTSIDRKFPIRVEEVILSGLASQKGVMARYTAEDRRLARQVAERMGLSGLEDRPIGALSGGQLQRTLLGRAVISDPEVVILDEPSTYLDRHFEAQLYQLLTDLNQRCAIILVSHDIGTVLRQVKSIACVNGTLDYHPDTGITAEWLERNFQCPIDLLGHGDLPHRVLGRHIHHPGETNGEETKV